MVEIPNNSSLRSLLFAIDKAVQYKDSELLYELKNLASENTFSDVHIITQDAIQTIRKDSYRTYDEEDVNEARDRLSKQAYGNFLEAAMTADYELRTQTFLSDYSEPKSYVFRSKYFNEEDKVIWSKLLEALKEQEYTSKEEGKLCLPIHDFLEELRLYMQRYCGKLIPITTAGYNLARNGVVEAGYSFRIYKFNGKPQVTGDAKLAKKLKASLVKSKNLEPPKKLEDLTLTQKSSFSLFEHEL